MNAIQILSTQPWVERLGRTLVYFLWQGAAIAALYAVARASARHAAPHRRYLLACVALATMLVAPIATYSFLGAGSARNFQADSMLGPADAEATTPNADSGTRFPVSASESIPALWSQRILPPIVILWLAGVLFFSVRLTGGWLTSARRYKHRSRTAPMEWQQTLDRLKGRLGVSRPVRLLVSAWVEAPAMVGWLRPVVLVPVGALAGLPADHLEALLLHELAHIRRHDYLIDVLQNIAEAQLFYHPAVWWISGHIRAERELCCDDLAVAVTGDAFTFAVALTDLEACRPVHAPHVLAANGGRLVDRIARLLGQPRLDSPRVSAPGIGASVACAALLAVITCLAFGQSADRPKFEVASIRPEPTKARTSAGVGPLPGGRLRAENATVRMLIMGAYRVKDFQIVGGPAWIGDDGFDIEAKGDANATRAQVLLMLQSLLEERFKLQFRHETRELPVFALSVGKGGKLPAPKEGGCRKPDGSGAPPSFNALPPCGGLNVGASGSGMSLRGGDVPMAELVRTLSSLLGRPVLDRTGITAHFDVNLDFTMDDPMAGSRAFGSVQGHNETMAAATGDPGASTNILFALREQLGLKLDSARGPVEVMVVDHVEKPGAN